VLREEAHCLVRLEAEMCWGAWGRQRLLLMQPQVQERLMQPQVQDRLMQPQVQERLQPQVKLQLQVLGRLP
jgi:hypothetical protein